MVHLELIRLIMFTYQLHASSMAIHKGDEANIHTMRRTIIQRSELQLGSSPNNHNNIIIIVYTIDNKSL